MKLENIGFYTLSDDRAFNVSETSQMMRCEMIINEYCNFKCPYCQGLAKEVFADRKRKELSLEEIKTNIDLWCLNKPLKNIRFSGGEPTYHRNIVEIIQYAKYKGIERIAVSTNGANKLELYDKLIEAGVNDFSISLDADNAIIGDKMAGNIKGAWERVIATIKHVSPKVYTTVGIVLNPENIDGFIGIVNFADSLGVADIRVIPSSQWDESLTQLTKISEEVKDRHPILKYRVNNFILGKHVRGINPGNSRKCFLVMDDSVIAGQSHFPCVIYMREHGQPIGSVGPNMRQERIEWMNKTDVHNDPICSKNCLDVCVDYNDKVKLNKLWQASTAFIK